MKYINMTDDMKRRSRITLCFMIIILILCIENQITAFAAMYNYPFPKGQSKKGLQVCEDMIEDAQELNVSHASINIAFHEMFARPYEKNNAQAIAFAYKGRIYWFSRETIGRYDTTLQALRQCNAVVSAILLLAWRDDLSYMVDPSVKAAGQHFYYAWNTTDKAARESFEAALTFLAKRYSGAAGSYGRIVNWIVGNEVNRYNEWNFSNLSFKKMVRNYVNGFRLVCSTVRRVYARARVYIPLDHYWGTSVEGSVYAGRAYLDEFAAQISKAGKIKWNLALHPYSALLGQTDFWNNASYLVNNKETSPLYSMKNINMVTAYVKKHFGKNVHIILSEQGYSSVHSGTDVSRTQAAAILYSYYLTENNDMIDSFIMNRHVDHIAEEEGGCAFGLWTNNDVENASLKKPSWTTFKYMDTNAKPAKKESKKALKEIGVKSWKTLITNYNAGVFKKISLQQGKLEEVSGNSQGRVLPKGWRGYGAIDGFSGDGNMVLVHHNSMRNNNSLWGIAQTFRKKLSFTKYPCLATMVRINSSQAQGAVLKIRIYAGKKIFECEKAISCGRDVHLKVSLEKWKYRKKVTKIMIAIAPLYGSWGAEAGAVISMPVASR